MKRHELLAKLKKEGCKFLEHGSRHDLYINPANGRKAPIPRHGEIKNTLCMLIFRQLGIEK